MTEEQFWIRYAAIMESDPNLLSKLHYDHYLLKVRDKPKDTSKLRVAVYCRVATFNTDRFSSFEVQRVCCPKWHLAWLKPNA